MTCDNVSFQAVPDAEGFPTVAAAHGALPSVHSYMHRQCQPAIELLIAIRTSSSGAISMHTHTMGHQARAIFVKDIAEFTVILPTSVAAVRPWPRCPLFVM